MTTKGEKMRNFLGQNLRHTVTQTNSIWSWANNRRVYLLVTKQLCHFIKTTNLQFEAPNPVQFSLVSSWIVLKACRPAWTSWFWVDRETAYNWWRVIVVE